MLSPEVWNFEAPHSIETVKVGELTEQNQELTLKNIDTFYFTHLVTVITPGRPPASLIDDSTFYKVLKLSIHRLAEPNFIKGFINKGKLTALSIGTRIDADDCFCVTPVGKLILSLRSETYTTLGLQGKASRESRQRNRYTVTLDLAGDRLMKSRKDKDVVTLLKKLKPLTMIMAWRPPEENICPSSIAKYFADLGYQVDQCVNSSDGFTEMDSMVPIPLANSSSNDKDELKDSIYEIVEWMGMIALKCELKGDGFVSTYKIPSDNTIEAPLISVKKFQGFFTIDKVKAFIESLIRHTLENQWFYLYVQGFSDSPVNWGINEHNFYTNGDNSYALLFFGNKNNSNKKFFLATNETSNRTLK